MHDCCEDVDRVPALPQRLEREDDPEAWEQPGYRLVLEHDLVFPAGFAVLPTLASLAVRNTRAACVGTSRHAGSTPHLPDHPAPHRTERPTSQPLTRRPLGHAPGPASATLPGQAAGDAGPARLVGSPRLCRAQLSISYWPTVRKYRRASGLPSSRTAWIASYMASLMFGSVSMWMMYTRSSSACASRYPVHRK